MPSLTDPLPAGKPLPFGATVISIFATSSAVRTRPAFCCAKHPNANRSGANLDIDILHRAVGFDAPALNSIEVIELSGRILRNPRARLARTAGDPFHCQG